MSNAFHFDGRLADAPQQSSGPNSPVRFKLIRNEFAGTDDAGKPRPERVVAVPFVAWGGAGKAILEHVRKGDQLIVTARVENNRYTHEGREVYDYNFVVSEFDFGSPGEIKRAELEQRSR